MLGEELLGLFETRGARREARAVLAVDPLSRFRRRLEIFGVEVLATRDAVDVLVLMICSGPWSSARGIEGLLFSLRESRLAFHAAWITSLLDEVEVPSERLLKHE